MTTGMLRRQLFQEFQCHRVKPLWVLSRLRSPFSATDACLGKDHRCGRRIFRGRCDRHLLQSEPRHGSCLSPSQARFPRPVADVAAKGDAAKPGRRRNHLREGKTPWDAVIRGAGHTYPAFAPALLKSDGCPIVSITLPPRSAAVLLTPNRQAVGNIACL